MTIHSKITKKRTNKKAIVIGETNLCIQCIKYLIDCGWKVVFVVSDDNDVISWAKGNSISTLANSQLHEINEKQKDNFYFFSIINPYLIPKHFLENKNILLALNYHDSPLPRYAGVNSTVWAIINDERQHGVTLHRIKSGIDDGDIAAQALIDIEKDETAVSLNLKCSEHLLELFKDVIAKIETGTLKLSKQNLANRSYYGLKNIPDNYGIINGTSDFGYIYRLVRGLSFGDRYDNPVATVKTWINNNFYIVESFNTEIVKRSNGKPKKQNKDNKGTVIFNEVRDIYGNKTNLKIKTKEILTKYTLTKEELQYLSKIKVSERKHKRQILQFFNDYADASTKVFDHITSRPSNKRYTRNINIPNNLASKTILALVSFILIRYFREDFIISLYLSDEPIPKNLRGLVEIRNFIYASKDLLNKSFIELEGYLTQTQKMHYILTRDFSYRYKVQSLTDIAITLGRVASTDKHKMVIRISNNKIEIQGVTNVQTQIDSIAETLAAQFSKNIQEEISPKDLKYIDILSQKQYQKIVIDYNKTDRNYPRDKTIHQLFEEQVLKTPNNIAVVYGNTKLTYQELNQKANQLAHRLRQNNNIDPDDLIALVLDRSEYIIITMLGVLKSGGAYVPIDPSNPDKRIGYILDDTNAKVILTNDIYEERLRQIIGQGRKEVISIDSREIQVELAKQKDTNPTTTATSADLMYVIYTSGTTGNPKGVLVAHCGVVNFMNYLIDYIKLDNSSRGSSYAGFGFDALVTEIYPLLLAGGAVYIITNEDKNDSITVNDFFNRYRITYAFLPTQFAELFLELQNTNLTNLIIAGDKLNKFIKQKYRVINAYGPTEASVHTTSFIIDKTYDNIPIGKPIDNVKCYVVDGNINILPIGAAGELTIGGESLARGYLNQPDLTAEKFVSNPFQTQEEREQNKNSRLYKTGDLVRVLPDGNIEYIGRSDFQVKIRGYRIELSEVEKHLMNYPQIKQAVILTKEQMTKYVHNKYLLAYYVADKKLDESKMLAYLAAQLPDYMLPYMFIHLDKLPLTVHGKLDIKALKITQEPGFANYVAPKTEAQAQMVGIWSQVLVVPEQSIGIKDDFFNLGGSSITAIKLTWIINQQLKSNIRVRDILNNRTIEKLVKLITSNNIHQFVFENYVIKNSNTSDLYKPFELTNVQQAYYFGRFQSLILGNISAHLYIEYNFAFLDVLKLEIALNKLITRHYNLRMIFENGKQHYLEYYPHYQVRFYQLNDISELESMRQQYSHKIYAPNKLWLFDVFVTKFANKYILHLSLDGLVFDAYSIGIFLSELSELYKDPLYKLPELKITYRDYIGQYNLIKQSDLFIKAKEYWSNRFNDYNFTFDLPLKKQPNVITQPKFVRISKDLDAKTWGKITTKANHYGIGPTVVILQVYGHVLSYWSNQNKLCINLTLFNRLPLHKQVNNLLGDFTVLELFNYVGDELGVKNSLLTVFKNTYNRLWDDIEHNLFDGLDFQRLIREELSLSLNDKAIAPVVLTSIFGIDYGNKKILDESFHGIGYSITQTPQVWLDNKAYEREGRMVAEWDYVEELFERENIEAMYSHYINLIKYIADANWEEDSLPILTLPKFDQRLINRANIVDQPYSEDTLFSRYEALMVKDGFGERVAVICGSDHNRAHTYQKLLENSNLLSRYILSIIGTNNLLVAILSSKGYNQVLCSLAIMKAGFGYVPLNVDWPVARIESILDQAGVHTLLISKAEYFNVGYRLEPKYQLIVIEETLEVFSSDKFKQRELLKIKLPEVKADDIAYVIFTSGSTGSPKGVTVSHRGALNTIDAVNNKFNVTKQDVVFAISELSFDLSVYDIFGILAVGGKIVFPAQSKTKEPKHWVELIKCYNVTIWNSVPQLADLLIDELAKISDLDVFSLRLFLLSGDWVPVNLPDRIKKYCQQARVISLGGATEGSIWSIWYDIDKINKNWSSIPYGVAMPNQRMYVLNHSYEHCPIGVGGEIYIGGLGVALNYWRDEIRTNASFINSRELGRLYKTGDLGKWNRDGYIEFLGRKDSQVKIRGYRIELGEIESQLSKVSGVKQAIVDIVLDNKERKIIAYVVPEKDNLALHGNNSNVILGYEERLSFKLTQPGLRKLTGNEKTIELLRPANSFIEQDYFKRKSYRAYYKEEALPVDLVKKLLDGSIGQGPHTLKPINFDLPTLSRVLLPLMGYVYEENPLPKYRYPSAGSLYPVQIYIKANFGKDKAGFFYYDRIGHKLRLVANNFESSESLLPKIYLVAKYLAIKPLYEALAKEFCLLEAGYIHGLLNLDGRSLGLEWEYSEISKPAVANLNLEEESEVIACLIPKQKRQNQKELLKTYFYVKPDRIDSLSGGWYKYYNSTFHKILDDILPENPVLNDNDSMWYDSAFGIFYVSEDADGIKKKQLLEAGIKAQIHMEEGVKNSIGLCAIGDISNVLQETVRKIAKQNTIVHFLLGGGITDEQIREKGLSKAKVENAFKQQIVVQLTKQLPDYMVPSYIVLLDKIPLTANGKLDIKALPKPGEDLKQSKVAYVAPTNELEYKICAAYEEILNLPINTVGVHEDFFKIGGDSMHAIKLTSKLQQYLKINLIDLFRLKTPAKIAQRIPKTTVGFDLPQKLQRIVQLYQARKPTKVDMAAAGLKRDKYLQEVKQPQFTPQLKNIKNVLLTGATGFLGCNILYQLLTTTDYRIHLLIRGDSDEHSYKRINSKFNFYFGVKLADYKDRIAVYCSNLEQPNLGLKAIQYRNLTTTIDSIIHAAALVRYYGEYDAFYKVNVLATTNLLELAKLTTSKDFHYISTNGIFLVGYIPNCSYYVFDEGDTPELLVGDDNFYYKTKYRSEVIVRDYRKYDITSNIYRIGNLTAHSANYRHQENIEDNGFTHCVKTMLSLRAIFEEDYSAIEMSPVNCVALAIVKIFNQVQLSNQNYHVFNPKTANLFELFSAYNNLHVQKLTIDKFVDTVLEKVDISLRREQIDLFMLYQWWTQYIKYPHLTKIEVLQNKTDAILNKLGFEWPEINHKMLSEIVKKGGIPTITN